MINKYLKHPIISTVVGGLILAFLLWLTNNRSIVWNWVQEISTKIASLSKLEMAVPLWLLFILFLGGLFLFVLVRKYLNTKSAKKEIVTDKSQRQIVSASTSATFFDQRFGLAFPGLRETEWFSGKEAVTRLSKLLETPLEFDNGNNGLSTPIWWWRDGSLGINKYKNLGKNEVLIASKELKIKKIAAVYSQTYYRAFIYVETGPMNTIGIYNDHDKAWEKELIKYFGYAYEEYGLFKGKNKVSRPEYDDNAAVINGKIVELGKDVELRVRHITPYNFIIAPHSSPINNHLFDTELDNHLGLMLQGKATIEELIVKVNELPKSRLLISSSY